MTFWICSLSSTQRLSSDHRNFTFFGLLSLKKYPKKLSSRYQSKNGGFWVSSHTFERCCSCSVCVNQNDTPHDSQEKFNIDTFSQPINILSDMRPEWKKKSNSRNIMSKTSFKCRIFESRAQSKNSPSAWTERRVRNPAARFLSDPNDRSFFGLECRSLKPTEIRRGSRSKLTGGNCIFDRQKLRAGGRQVSNITFAWQFTHLVHWLLLELAPGVLGPSCRPGCTVFL